MGPPGTQKWGPWDLSPPLERAPASYRPLSERVSHPEGPSSSSSARQGFHIFHIILFLKFQHICGCKFDKFCVCVKGSFQFNSKIYLVETLFLAGVMILCDTIIVNIHVDQKRNMLATYHYLWEYGKHKKDPVNVFSAQGCSLPLRVVRWYRL